MKLLIIALAAFICSAGPTILGTGEPCSSSDYYIVTNFEVTPYPPTSGVKMNIIMAGTFGHDEYISDIVVKTSYNSGRWTYNYIDIDENFSYGQMFPFSFSTTAGNASGIYEVEVELERKQGYPVSCWTFTYHI